MRTRFVLLLAVLFVSPSLGQGFRDAQIKPHKITDSVYMLEDQGGNIGLSIGEDGAFVIDDQFAPLTGKIMAAIEGLTDEPVRFVVNTHWHGDHTGGNENFGETGAVIVAHDNVRERMSTEQFIEAFNRSVPASPEGAWPVITFTDTIRFHWNGDTIDVIHVDPAHTDGDSIIHFRKANVIHMGDTYFNGMYPFIDSSSGGSVAGMIRCADRALALCNADTTIIPGHGSLATPDDLRNYRNMLATVEKRVRKLMDEGKSLEEIAAAAPTADFDETWGNGFLDPDRWLGIVHGAMGK